MTTTTILVSRLASRGRGPSGSLAARLQRGCVAVGALAMHRHAALLLRLRTHETRNTHTHPLLRAGPYFKALTWNNEHKKTGNEFLELVRHDGPKREDELRKSL